MKKGGQLELLALLSTVLGISWKEVEERTLLTSNHCESAFCWIDLLPPLYKSWSCSFFPVEVNCHGFIAASTMSLMSNIGLSKKAQTLTVVSPKEIRGSI